MLEPMTASPLVSGSLEIRNQTPYPSLADVRSPHADRTTNLWLRTVTYPRVPANHKESSRSVLDLSTAADKKYCSIFVYFIDRATRYKFLSITNLMHFFMYLFISSLYMFRSSQCSSSGDRIALIHHLV